METVYVLQTGEDGIERRVEKTKITVRFAGKADGVVARFNDRVEAGNAVKVLRGMLLAAKGDDTAYNEAAETWYEMLKTIESFESGEE